MKVFNPEALKELRKARGLTQQALSDAVGVAISQEQFWEAGKYTPKIPNLCALADALGVDIADLLKEQEADSELDYARK
ncbi:MAG: helix-turn-helix domain-containing protein [Streptosporangiaceae bacterium]